MSFHEQVNDYRDPWPGTFSIIDFLSVVVLPIVCVVIFLAIRSVDGADLIQQIKARVL